MADRHAPAQTVVPSQTRYGEHASNTVDVKQVNNAYDIAPHGDLIIEYTDPSAVSHRWKVSSQLLMEKSPYFKALLHPDKFAEGRQFAQQRYTLNDGPDSDLDSNTHPLPSTVLPTFKIMPGSTLDLCGADAVELFLRIICLESLADETRVEFEDSLKSRPPAVVARLIEVADWFNSPRFIRNTLRGVGYMFGKKDRTSQGTFGPALLKMKEERVRQNIVISQFLQSDLLFQTMTHTLLVSGSKFWVDGLERPATEHLRWRYLPDGVEEELYYRRQCVLDTITDLHAHFFRKFGALEDTEGEKPTSTPSSSLGAAFSTSTQIRRFQCRAGLDNASQCDLFHLGQMTRFFTMRAKTIFVGSTLLDPDFNEPTGEDEASETEELSKHQPSSSSTPSDITGVLASLKQYPDYQIDSNHQACGVRRRLLPIIPCIEKYISDPRGLLGIDREDWEQQPRVGAWKTNSGNDHTVGIRFSQITDIKFSAKARSVTTFPLKSEAWLLFTAKKRNWEA